MAHTQNTNHTSDVCGPDDEVGLCANNIYELLDLKVDAVMSLDFGGHCNGVNVYFASGKPLGQMDC